MSSQDAVEQARRDLVKINGQPYNAEAPSHGLAGDVTPTGQHYVRSNFAVPAHDGTLVIGGAVDHPLVLTLEDLRAMTAVEHVVTLECAGNGRLETRPLPAGEPWGRNAVSTAVWTGARLRDLLDQVHPHADGVELRCEGGDGGIYHLTPVLPETGDHLGFVRSLDLGHARDPRSDILIT